MNSDERILTALRLQAWSRVKGELNAMLQTYFGHRQADGHSTFLVMQERIDAFVKEMEDNL